MQRELYLDLDGVCVDFIRGAIAAHDHNPDEVLTRWAAHHRGEFLPYKVMGIELDPFLDRLGELGESFWIQLEPFPWFDELYNRLSAIGHVVFCTATTRSPSCLSGKLHWLQDRFGNDFQDFILTSHKHRLAHANACLIDDFDDNIDRFRQRGGQGVLFPQIWNSNHAVDQNPVEYVLERVAEATPEAQARTR